jgi:uncharacterized membrane protein (DUF485 family)
MSQPPYGAPPTAGLPPVAPFGGADPGLSEHSGPLSGLPLDQQPDYLAIQASPEFADLRRRLRRFVFPMAVVFLGWYLLFVLLAAYAHDFMSHRLYGSITVGLLMGVLQFVSTLAITTWYVRFARRRIDPRVAGIRRQAGQETE